MFHTQPLRKRGGQQNNSFSRHYFGCNAHYTPATSIYLPPRYLATFRIQPLRKRGEPQNNSPSRHYFEK